MSSRIDLFKDTLHCCELALKKNPHMFPLQMAIDQINYLIEIQEGFLTDLSFLNKINIGWVAARELDGFSDIDLINKLHLISAEVKKIKEENGYA